MVAAGIIPASTAEDEGNNEEEKRGSLIKRKPKKNKK